MSSEWIPLEADPLILNEYLDRLGSNTHHQYSFNDVYGVDPDLLSMVPQPVLSVLLLYPITRSSEAASAAQSQRVRDSQPPTPSSLYFIKQTVGNACGTIALIHTVLNHRDELGIDGSKFFGEFYSKTASFDPDQRAAALESNTSIAQSHEAVANQGKTDAQAAMDTNLHFICFIEHAGRLYELDGRKSCPIDHGACTRSDLLHNACSVIKQQFIDQDASQINFNIMALCANQQD